MEHASHGDVFTCTFCRGISAGPPRVLGRSARLTCEPCYSALIDLSICWVCGEVILREDECVSLDWCFWHPACYGCLLCGSRRICAGVPVHALFGCGEGAGRGWSGQGELTEPPLCAMCVVEVESAGLDDEGVVRRGLRRVSMVDGGVSRERWIRKQGQQDGPARHARVRQESRRPLGAVGGNGAANEAMHTDDAPVTTIWVDIHDPVNGVSFKPSLLKPIPLSMQLSAVGGASAADGLSARPAQIATHDVCRGAGQGRRLKPMRRGDASRLRHSESGPSRPSDV